MEAEQIASWAVPFILAAAETYGDRVLIVAEDMAASATVALGLDLLRRLFRHPHHQTALRDAVRGVAHGGPRGAAHPGAHPGAHPAHPGTAARHPDPDAEDQLRDLVCRILRSDPQLAAEVRDMMPR